MKLQELPSRMAGVYRHLVTQRPGLLLIALGAILAVFAYHARSFELDASADSLLLEGDPDLQRMRQVNARYGGDDFLIVTFTPEEDLFSDASLERIAELRNDLREVQGVASVMTILDVPLLKSSDIPLLQQLDQVQTLEAQTVDRDRAREELTESPVFRDLVISRDADTTALLVDLEEDRESSELLETRNELLIRRGMGQLDAAGARQLADVAAAYEGMRPELNNARHRTIGDVRAVLSKHAGEGTLHLGGVPMIADDMVTFVRNDLIVFGAGVFFFVIVVLSLIFRRVRWVLLPLACCTYASVVMLGALGWIGWEVTVISSNFLALMLIITISMTIHLAVRYRQLQADTPGAAHADLVWTALRRMVWPCLYTALTTILGFGSLVVSDIKPVQDFGWMMSVGLAVAFLTSFSLFPALLSWLGKTERDAPQPNGRLQITARLATLTERHGGAIVAAAVGLAVLSAIGIARLEVENSFIDYFRDDTEIYQGMKLIDEKLGGTTPFQILLRFGDPIEESPVDAGPPSGPTESEEDEYLDWELDAGPQYWFTPSKIERIKRVHDYLESLPHTGKVLSLASVIRVAEDINDGKELDSLDLGVLYNTIPEDVRRELIDPYFSYEADEARIVVRVRDSEDDLRRKALLDRIQGELGTELGLEPDEFVVTGTLVLYNNMLQSLYRSQVSSLGAVMLGILLMLVLLFRSLSLAVIGIVPNLLAAGAVLGLMGWLGIPLDVMTITVAAITIGIAVDNAIHYIYRFREEYPRAGGYVETLHVCHGSIGRAVLYTSATIILGFSILSLSNFWPTIYFGSLTGIAMGIALLAALTLLPKLILLWRPFTRDPLERSVAAEAGSGGEL